MKGDFQHVLEHIGDLAQENNQLKQRQEGYLSLLQQVHLLIMREPEATAYPDMVQALEAVLTRYRRIAIAAQMPRQANITEGPTNGASILHGGPSPAGG